MLFFKRLPWMSLLLVLISYSTLGWVLSETHTRWYIWTVVIIAILLLIGSLTAPLSTVANYSTIFLKSSSRSFLVAVFGAFLFFLMVAWFRLFLDTLLIIAAAVLARIDFQTSGFKEEQAFLLTSLFSLAGMAGGAAAHIELSQLTHLW
ncbi:hypothetical protein H6G76_19080 [Nostoc sp. FACHB-152]|uniref:hypothetical protein n=1 Tax=unclassified Nostoc TaxID=2593658 RepID=UPI001684AEFC|nr:MULTISPECIES: hypothetical protein [unclassified Nostoc]MBD2449220.1 hypothetical protein [Nostoc sp. FACHB-152]MBD2466369.1 hypothetical protein [Nostoc sp. FACHB-145]